MGAPFVVDWVSHNAAYGPGALALVDIASQRRFTYQALDERVGRVTGALQKAGVAPGDRVGHLVYNSTDIFEVIFGCWRANAVSLALNGRQPRKKSAL